MAGCYADFGPPNSACGSSIQPALAATPRRSRPARFAAWRRGKGHSCSRPCCKAGRSAPAPKSLRPFSRPDVASSCTTTPCLYLALHLMPCAANGTEQRAISLDSSQLPQRPQCITRPWPPVGCSTIEMCRKKLLRELCRPKIPYPPIWADSGVIAKPTRGILLNHPINDYGIGFLLVRKIEDEIESEICSVKLQSCSLAANISMNS